ncbi:MAG: 50S ribosomal protein L11 methyltransferase [Chlamydiales bacterium]|nr:50S ribosomal protein L11 methyltransferase [Chlamydiales bacterium]
MNWTVITLVSTTDPDDAWDQLQAAGANPLFADETPGSPTHIIVEGPVPDLPFIASTNPYEGATETDWQAQWETHGHHFHDGHVHIDVGGQTLKLKPGPGFGDLSHPTTHLALELMSPLVPGQVVLDIGCGSGVLTLAAAMAGAKHAYGVDIEPDALLHSSENAELNSLEDLTTFARSIEINPDVVVINMIWSEQREAWREWAASTQATQAIIASGILATEGDEYAEYMKQWNWRVDNQMEREGWLGFVFVKSVK